MSRVLTVRGVHNVVYKGVRDDGLWRYNVSLRPASVKRQMGRDPIVVIGRYHFKLKRVRPLDRPPDGERRRYRIVCELVHTDPR